MPPHRAQSSVRVNATLHHPLFTSCVFLSVHVWDHRAYGAVRRVHSFFPYNVTDARNTYVKKSLCVEHTTFVGYCDFSQ